MRIIHEPPTSGKKLKFKRSLEGWFSAMLCTELEILEGSVFANGPGDLGFNPRSRHTKDLEKWYLIPPCLTLSDIMYVTKVKWSNPGKGVAPSPTPRVRSY